VYLDLPTSLLRWNRGLGSCPRAAAGLQERSLGMPLPQSSLWKPKIK
jgi:hypothetical protein